MAGGQTTSDFHLVAIIVDDAVNTSPIQWMADALPHYHLLKRLPKSLQGSPFTKVLITKTP